VTADAPLVAILAGGEGRRMGGGKPTRTLGGQRLIDRAVGLARQWSDEPLVVLREAGQIESLDERAIFDAPGIEGPLAGLAAALGAARAAGRDRVLTFGCDMPFLPADLGERLSEALATAPGIGAAVAASGGRLHPICALWRAEAGDRIDDYAATGRRSLRGFAEAVGCVAVDWPVGEVDPFLNVNSEEELKAAEALLRA
jgi:molybdopterin-guanine dinucleotide biosynthesis protein A